MKRISYFVYVMALAATLASCKCHKSTTAPVVTVEARFEAGDTWMLTSMQGKEYTPTEGRKKISIQFNPEAGTVNGNSGCNRYFAQFKDLGGGKMELNELNATKKACSESIHKVETAYLLLLRRCDGYRLGEYTLELTQNDKVLLTFEKVVYEE